MSRLVAGCTRSRRALSAPGRLRFGTIVLAKVVVAHLSRLFMASARPIVARGWCMLLSQTFVHGT
eukprot:15475930-Alexandrium_andersonii.AAC.1